MDPLMRTACFVVTALLLAGCSQSQYLVVEPEEFARTVELQHTFIERPPIDYQLFVENGRLRMYANNHDDTPIKLIGGDSYLVDPTGQSHGLRSQTIAPGSFIAFTMPPRRPRGSGVGLGMGVGGGSDGTFGGIGIGRHWHDNEPYMGVDDPPYYDWGHGDVRLHLALEQGDQRSEHEFLFRREKKSD